MAQSKTVLATAFLLVCCGCTQHLIMTDPRITEAAHSGQVASVGFGKATSPDIGVDATENCGNDALAIVRVKRNFGQALISFITLGAYAPATIDYACAIPRPPQNRGSQDEDGAVGGQQ